MDEPMCVLRQRPEMTLRERKKVYQVIARAITFQIPREFILGDHTSYLSIKQGLYNEKFDAEKWVNEYFLTLIPSAKSSNALAD